MPSSPPIIDDIYRLPHVFFTKQNHPRLTGQRALILARVKVRRSLDGKCRTASPDRTSTDRAR